ncbi:hypothetical protein WME76_41650 [Sorangium sp. So ce119]|uniref:hypothetical protein n=1 Tax=Sorangium sp. So ce119 TaxID=3133279 RepID=UPI003F5E1A65
MRTLRPSHVIAGLLAAALSLMAAPSAAGEVLPGGARLSYARDPGAAACPDEEGFRNAVATRLGGVDPFSPDGAWRVEVAITRRANDFKAEVALYDGRGQPRGRQERAAPDCRALVDDITLTLSVAMRPLPAPTAPDAPAPDEAATEPPRAAPESQPPASPPAGAAPSPPPAPRRAPPPVRAAPPARAVPPAVLPSVRPRLQLGAGPVLAAGFAPGLSVGFSGFVGLRWPDASLLVEARGDLPVTSTPRPGMTIDTAWLGGSVVPCLHGTWFFGCGLVTAGRLQRSVRAKRTFLKTDVQIGLGLRAGAEASVSSRLASQLTVDLLVNARRPRLWYNNGEASFAGTASGVVTLRFVASF